jgi:hypothetical protein
MAREASGRICASRRSTGNAYTRLPVRKREQDPWIRPLSAALPALTGVPTPNACATTPALARVRRLGRTERAKWHDRNRAIGARVLLGTRPRILSRRNLECVPAAQVADSDMQALHTQAAADRLLENTGSRVPLERSRSPPYMAGYK